MTVSGWIMMISVVGSITALLLWCSWKVSRLSNSSEYVHPMIDIDTPDMHEKE